MRHLRIKDLIDLVIADVPEGEEKIQKMYEWHFERVKIISQWVLGAAVSLFIAVLVAFFEPDTLLQWWHGAIAAILALSAGTYGVYRLFQLGRLHQQFVAALKIFCELKKMKSFFVRYQGTIR